MTKEQVIAWARECGADVDEAANPAVYASFADMQRFAKLVRNAALEEAARECNDRETVAAVHHEKQQAGAVESAKEFTAGVAAGSRRNAQAIRNLKEPTP